MSVASADSQAAALHRGPEAAGPRSLVDILEATCAAHPDAAALDDGTSLLTYSELRRAVNVAARRLALAGVGRGDRVGVRIPSGTNELYVSILAVLAAGACYVPVDAEDPEERIALVLGEADVAAVMGPDGTVETRRPAGGAASGGAGRDAALPEPGDDAWVIFTSGSTGTPKGVAVTHRSAAAFVDAEARLFLRGGGVDPIGPDDRVLAGLSVAFDASCEEMWLAWRHGACLVPAPRALVRSGMDLGPWLVRHDITVVSTVPTLASLWPAEALDAVRLLIFGGEACPPDLAERLAVDGREVWNTYGPTEATVVACGARLTGEGPVRIGLPLDGWDLAVVGSHGEPVAEGEVGELVIGGVGLARYLDAAKDAEKYAPLESVGWDRAYRSGDLVRFDPAGLEFVGRADDQVKLGGRRIELGEVDAALLALPGVAAAAAVVQRSRTGNQLLVGYIVPEEATADPPPDTPGVDTPGFDKAAALHRLREELPSALVPLLAVVDDLPTRTSGKVDRNALPWPLPDDHAPTTLAGTAGWVAEQWAAILGTGGLGADDDFFAHGGGSLSAAQLVASLRERFPGVTVADVYDHPRLGAMAEALDGLMPAASAEPRVVRPVPRHAHLLQTLLSVPLQTVVGLRWLTALAAANWVLSRVGAPVWAPTVSPWWLLAGLVLLFTPPGRMGLAAMAARALLRGVQPGTHPRGGSAHLRIWFTERFVEALGATNLGGAPWIPYFARALGAKVGRDVDLHSLPPVTGMLTLGKGCSIEPEVDLSGWWLDGDTLHVGPIKVGAGARVGTRSTLLPGAEVGKGAAVLAGSVVFGRVPAGRSWGGSPAARLGAAPVPGPEERPARATRWVLAFGVSSAVVGGLPLVAAAAGLVVVGRAAVHRDTLGAAARAALAATPVAALVALVVMAVLTAVMVRALGLGVKEGHHPVRSRTGWQVWTTLRLMDDARTWLFPLYSSLVTPAWLRVLGARVGRGVEASTVLMLPKMTTVDDGAFLADDTMVGVYELGGGWMRVEPTRIGRRSFLGNSGMTAPGRRVRKHSLIAVLSAAPEEAKAGSSWLGSPPVRLRRPPGDADESLTFDPPRRVRAARGAMEVLRLVPVVLSFALAVGVLLLLEWAVVQWGWPAAAATSGLVLIAAGATAAAITTLAKWVMVGRVPAGEHPLWSSFVWRNEVVDTFVEMMVAPWFARAATGTPELSVWLRSLGARIGRGVWCETYWLPEADLVRLGDAVSVNRGCVLQTHLFHDRVMSIDGVTLEPGATLGPHGVILPAAEIGAGTTVGPGSLVMRGDVLPAGTRWTGNPIAPWPGSTEPHRPEATR